MNARAILRAIATRVLAQRTMEEASLLHRVLGRGPPGVLLDVGAHVGSTLLPFAEAGWEVHAFEPDSINREQLNRNSAHLRNVTVVPMAVADVPGEVTLYRSGESTGISSLAAFTRSHVAGEVVAVTTLTTYLAQAQPREVTLLKIDVEGYERFVLRGFPWDRHMPRAVLLEFEDRKTSELGYVWTDLADDLRGHGYEVFVSEWQPIARYGGTHRWRRFFAYPGRLRDPAAWGNLVAVRKPDRRRLERELLIAGAQHRAWRAADSRWNIAGRGYLA